MIIVIIHIYIERERDTRQGVAGGRQDGGGLHNMRNLLGWLRLGWLEIARNILALR